MSYVCEICGKKTSTGRSQQHHRGVAGKRWKKRTQVTPRLFKPNLQRVTLKVGEEVKKVRICTKCIKRIKKFGSIKNLQNVSLV